MSRIVLCADDYGLSPAVSRGMRELLEMRRISAVSCMVTFPEFEDDGPRLRPYFDRADIGLHVTFSGGYSLEGVVAQADGSAPNLSAVLEAVEEQVTRFTRVMGRSPDYIDGHQHIHLHPVVREPIARAAARIGAWVRLTSEPVNYKMWLRPAPWESAMLALRSRPLARLARKLGVTTNRGFRGARTFREDEPFGCLFRRMIAGVVDGHLVVCHPGLVDDVLIARDWVRSTREEEMFYLAGGEFLRDIAQAGLTLGRLRESLPTGRIPAGA